jgi:hypothetical protein
MTAPVPANSICRRCAAPLDADDNYCRRCGAPTPFGVRAGILPAAKQPGIWESPWLILPLLFLVLGPLAFPLLWRSRRFTLLWKCVLTVLVTAMTVFFAWYTWVAIEQTLAPLLKEFKQAGL